MKMLFVLALLNALTSLLASMALSAMTLAPTPDAGGAVAVLTYVLIGFLFGWLGFAVWLKHPGREASFLDRSAGLRRFILALGVIHLLATLMLLIG
ncbi:MAG: hypothetical protein CJBNEKGG_00074 [Prosthecobacter sp.]|nr:hypothetical protein [Prosthecobacter sp.]